MQAGSLVAAAFCLATSSINLTVTGMLGSHSAERSIPPRPLFGKSFYRIAVVGETWGRIPSEVLWWEACKRQFHSLGPRGPIGAVSSRMSSGRLCLSGNQHVNHVVAFMGLKPFLLPSTLSPSTIPSASAPDTGLAVLFLNRSGSVFINHTDVSTASAWSFAGFLSRLAFHLCLL